MAYENSQVPWTDEQWARVRQVIQEEAHRARVAATFLPLYGPLPPDTDYVSKDVVYYNTNDARPRLAIDDTTTIRVPTLQVKVYLRGAQMADPELTSVLQLFRRAANVLARLEDAIVFTGQSDTSKGPTRTSDLLPAIWEVLGGQEQRGLHSREPETRRTAVTAAPGALGDQLVGSVTKSIGDLEASGHLGPFAVVLDQNFFAAVTTPNNNSLVLPQDRIIPFLGGGPLLRSSTLPSNSGVVVALGGAPVELVVATDVSLSFLQVTADPMFVFRVFEKVVLRIKEPDAIVILGLEHEAKAGRARK